MYATQLITHTLPVGVVNYTLVTGDTASLVLPSPPPSRLSFALVKKRERSPVCSSTLREGVQCIFSGPTTPHTHPHPHAQVPCAFSFSNPTATRVQLLCSRAYSCVCVCEPSLCILFTSFLFSYLGVEDTPATPSRSPPLALSCVSLRMPPSCPLSSCGLAVFFCRLCMHPADFSLLPPSLSPCLPFLRR